MRIICLLFALAKNTGIKITNSGMFANKTTFYKSSNEYDVSNYRPTTVSKIQSNQRKTLNI